MKANGERRTFSCARPRSWLSGETWLKPGPFALGLAAVLGALFAPVVLGQQSFFYRDFGLFSYPLAHFHRESFWGGRIPEWNPYSNCGLPFAAQWNTLVFYPGSLIYLLLPLPWSLNLYSLGHLWWAGVGMYTLARAWTGRPLCAAFAGIAFVGNGLALHFLMWTSNVAALAWMPWVLWLVERAWRRGGTEVWLAVLAGTIQMFTGAPEIILLTWLSAGTLAGAQTWAGWRRRKRFGRLPWIRMGRLMAVALWVAMLGAVQLWPFLDLAFASQRHGSFDTGAWAMPGWGWANLLVPLFHCTPSVTGVYSQDAQQWTSSYYLGVGVLALAWLGIVRAPSHQRARRWTLAMLACGGLLLAMGDNTPIYAALKSIIPGLGSARFPIKYVTLTVCATPILAAYGLREILRVGEGVRSVPWRLMRSGIVRAGIAMGCAIVLIVAWAAIWPIEGEAWSTTLRSGLTRLVFLGTLLVGAMVLAGAKSSRVSWWGPLVWLGVVMGDGLSHTPPQNPTVVAWAMERDADVNGSLPRAEPGRAMLSPGMLYWLGHASHPDPLENTLGQRKASYPNWNLLDHTPMVNGFFPLYFKTQEEVESILYARGTNDPGPLGDFLGVTWVSSDRELFAWERRASAMALVTGGQRAIVLNDAEVLTRLGRDDFAPRQEVFLAGEEPEALPSFEPTRVQVEEVRQEGGHMAIRATAESAAWLVIAQTWSKWWEARVNGLRTTVVRANHAYQAVPIPPGVSDVELVYRDQRLRQGAVVSVAGWIVFLAWGIGCRLRWRFVVARDG